MPTFVEKCNCRGIRPSKVIGKKHISRPEVIGKLLRDRNVARYIVAPSGFGKSHVAFEYAHIMFAFENTFWMECASPCFLRDIDNKTIFSSIVEVNPDVKLVVFDNIPVMNDGRATAFNDLINELLNINCEILAICAPPADTFSTFQKEKIRILPKDLMLSDEEMKFERSKGALDEKWDGNVAASRRVPCLVWADNGEKTLALSMGDESLVSSFKLVVIAMAVLRKGTFDDIGRFVSPKVVGEAVVFLDMYYPYLGVDLRTRTFDCVQVGLDFLGVSVTPFSSALAKASLHKDWNCLCMVFADVLFERGNFDDIVVFLSSFATKQCISLWLCMNGWKLIGKVSPMAIYSLCYKLDKNMRIKVNALNCMLAWSCTILNDTKGALKFAKRVAKSEAAESFERICSNLVILMVGSTVERKSALRSLESLKAECMESAGNLKPDGASTTFQIFNWSLLCACVYALNKNVECVLDLWRASAEAKPTSKDLNSLALMASVLLGMFITFSGKESSDIKPLPFDSWVLLAPKDLSDISLKDNKEVMDGLISKCVSIIESEDVDDWLRGMLCQRVREVYGLDDCSFEEGSSDKIERIISSVSQKMEGERRAFRKAKTYDYEKRFEYFESNPDVFRKEDRNVYKYAKSSATIPVLDISLFGGFEAKIDGVPLNSKYLRRKKARATLALLVINKGREISRDRTAKMLWPQNDENSCKSNFYSLWSQLKKALSIDGSCPYLIRTQDGCKLDTRFVTSDIYDFDKLCRELMFGGDDMGSWEDMYTKINDIYSRDLLPEECENEQIIHLREKCSELLVDGMVATSKRLRDSGVVQGSLWFAREAYRKNHKREDVHIALMEAQIAAEQRAGALETYFSCRKFLSEELGIDPSTKLIDLYRSIIETEEAI